MTELTDDIERVFI